MGACSSKSQTPFTSRVWRFPTEEDAAAAAGAGPSLSVRTQHPPSRPRSARYGARPQSTAAGITPPYGPPPLSSQRTISPVGPSPPRSRSAPRPVLLRVRPGPTALRGERSHRAHSPLPETATGSAGQRRHFRPPERADNARRRHPTGWAVAGIGNELVP